jgi:catechol 2,3-dioxygenase-like lactoylglutathione lyase family enzyme
MRLQPIIYTTDAQRAVDWYARVLGMMPNYASEVWTTFDVAGTTLAIHRVEGDLSNESRVAVSLVSSDPLESCLERWAALGIEPVRGIQDETFGRSVLLGDPDGTIIQVNEHTPM